MHSVRTCKYTEHYRIRPSPFVPSQVAPLLYLHLPDLLPYLVDGFPILFHFRMASCLGAVWREPFSGVGRVGPRGSGPSLGIR